MQKPRYTAEITDLREFSRWFYVNQPEEFRMAMTFEAARIIKSGMKDVPGLTITPIEQTAVR